MHVQATLKTTQSPKLGSIIKTRPKKSNPRCDRAHDRMDSNQQNIVLFIKPYTTYHLLREQNR